MNPGETLLSTFQLWRYGVGHSELFLRSGFGPQNEPVELRSPKHTGVITAGRMTYPDGQMKWTVTAPRGEEIGGGARPTCE